MTIEQSKEMVGSEELLDGTENLVTTLQTNMHSSKTTIQLEPQTGE